MSADELWADYLDLDANPHSYLAGMMAEQLIKADPKLFVQMMAEAQATA